MFGTQNDSKKQDDPMVNDQTFKDMSSSSPLTLPSYSETAANPVANTTGAPSVIAPTQNPQPLPMPAALPQASTNPLPPPTPLPILNIATTPSTFGAAASAPEDELMGIKHEALTELSPLVSHIDQTPTEKFRTLMMMIQGADDKSLIKPAYEAAKAITDDKERAQALLDIVNEINYFTQPKDAPQPPM